MTAHQPTRRGKVVMLDRWVMKYTHDHPSVTMGGFFVPLYGKRFIIKEQKMNDQSVNHPKYGDLWMCHLRGGGGSVQNGYRPVFILSNDKNNIHSTTINIIPLTSKMDKRRLPIHVELWAYKKYGLNAPSTMLIEQITTISKEDLDFCIGQITDERTLNKISRAIQTQFPIFNVLAS